MSPSNNEFQLYDLAAGLIREICSYLAVHEQLNMKSICKWWRLNLQDTCMSSLVEVDGYSMPNQSENLLEHTLNKHLQKNTRILVIRHMDFEPRHNKFGIIVRAVQQKNANLIRLVLKDCSVKEEYARIAEYWLNPDELTDFMLQRLIPATKKLILVNYTIWDALGFRSMFRQRQIIEEVSVTVLPRVEFDCTKPSLEQYREFIVALNCSFSDVSPQVRSDVVQLYTSWIHSDTPEYQWKRVNHIIKNLNGGVSELEALYTSEDVHVDIPALRQLDPLTLNKLTLATLHRLYF